jgi:hypothetical protein
MSKRLRKKLNAREPVRGDSVFVYDESAGDFVNATVQVITEHEGVRGMLVIAPGHSRSYTVFVPLKRRKLWRWPSEIRVHHARPMTERERSAVRDAVAETVRAQEGGNP